MKHATEKLLSICSGKISDSYADINLSFSDVVSVFNELHELLKIKNGFYGFESALHVYPSKSIGSEIGLIEWNKKNLWIDSYENLALDSVFFAEDLFGGQFCLKKDGIYSFDPETALSEKISDDLEGWCDAIIRDYDFMTGYTLSHAWQQKNGRLLPGHRLVPKKPFILGGEFDINNLYMEKSDYAMRMRASIALQLKNLKDGESVELKGI
ncbi:hypothetical protein ACVWWU_002693 [Pantoea sp. PA1]|jgi:hypothetical protein|uniref:SMI1/KNR4 family protein n=1 Tax=Pantoea ananas TaxID=553 RepID=UPI000DC29ECA|nr:SMI1/KNR4 family protein [Pantoea ananatis]MDH0053185.1 SMI1/KNR4 family protein [Pantoea ananatis]RAR74512.1 hypothetical protein C7420_101104 [Pantoea ananatis]